MNGLISAISSYRGTTQSISSSPAPIRALIRLSWA